MNSYDASSIVGQNQWVLAFISAHNPYEGVTPDVMKGIDANGVFAWMDNFCAAHPLDQIATATMALITELSNRGQQ
jgi:hypothetical protein